MNDKEMAAVRQALKALNIEDMACRYEKEPTPAHIANAITALQSIIDEQAAQPAAKTKVWDAVGYDALMQEMEMVKAERDKLKALAQTAREPLEKAYRAGFEASGEGYNAEYPFGDHGQNPEHEENWLKNRDEALAALAQTASSKGNNHD